MIKMKTDAAWVLANAEKEENGIVSVGGLFCALKKIEEEPNCDPSGIANFDKVCYRRYSD